MFFKERHRQRGAAQYERREVPAGVRVVHEGGYPFLVNLSEYLDTGLFLDGRGVRARLRELADGRSFLNLFAYSCTATVYAAKGSASSTTSLDLSPTYLAWGERNMAQSELTGRRHQLERADCLTWLHTQRRRFDLIYLAPPRFSRSKSMASSFDLQRDHVALLQDAARLLSPEGVLVFEVSARRFQLEQAALEDIELTDRSRETLSHDFKRRANRHRVWELRRGHFLGGARDA